jgi:hypothetical protein
VGLTNLGSELEKCVGSRIHLVGVSISFEKNFYRLPFTPPSLVRRIGPSGASTLDGPLRDVAGPSLSLPTVESETYSSTGGGGTASRSATLQTL